VAVGSNDRCAPGDLDVAICVHRLERALDIAVRRVEHRWAGLRSFVADRTVVCGWDSSIEGFFWLAGQGGYGIQTAPAVARTAASLLDGRGLPADIAALGITEASLSPVRCQG
jgi:D-arginine dehydrogenase